MPSPDYVPTRVDLLESNRAGENPLITFGSRVVFRDAEHKTAFIEDLGALLAAALDTDGTLAANSDTRVATQKAIRTYVAAQIAALVNSAPGALDTLAELAAAFGNDANFAATVTTALAGKVPTTRTVNGHALSSNVTITPTDLGLVIGTHVQAYSAALAVLAGKSLSGTGNIVLQSYADAIAAAKWNTPSNAAVLAEFSAPGGVLNFGGSPVGGGGGTSLIRANGTVRGYSDPGTIGSAATITFDFSDFVTDGMGPWVLTIDGVDHSFSDTTPSLAGWTLAENTLTADSNGVRGSVSCAPAGDPPAITFTADADGGSKIELDWSSYLGGKWELNVDGVAYDQPAGTPGVPNEVNLPAGFGNSSGWVVLQTSDMSTGHTFEGAFSTGRGPVITANVEGVADIPPSGEVTSAVIITGVTGKKIKTLRAFVVTTGDFSGAGATLTLTLSSGAPIVPEFSGAINNGTADLTPESDTIGAFMTGVTTGESLTLTLGGTIPGDIIATVYVTVEQS